MSAACVGVQIPLEFTNLGGNAEVSRYVLDIHSLGNKGAGEKLKLLVLMDS